MKNAERRFSFTFEWRVSSLHPAPVSAPLGGARSCSTRDCASNADVFLSPSACIRDIRSLRACLKIPWRTVFAQKAVWQGACLCGALRQATTEDTRSGLRARSNAARWPVCAKILRAAGLLAAAGVGSALTARCGDARASPPWPQPKSLAAGPHAIFKQSLGRDFDFRQAGGLAQKVIHFALSRLVRDTRTALTGLMMEPLQPTFEMNAN